MIQWSNDSDPHNWPYLSIDVFFESSFFLLQNCIFWSLHDLIYTLLWWTPQFKKEISFFSSYGFPLVFSFSDPIMTKRKRKKKRKTNTFFLKHRKNSKCCHHHSVFKCHNIIFHIVVLNCQMCYLCLMFQVTGHQKMSKNLKTFKISENFWEIWKCLKI